MTDEQRKEYHKRYMARIRAQEQGAFEPDTPKNVEKSSVWTIRTALMWERITRELRGAIR